MNSRKSVYNISDFILNRRSAYAMSGESISDDELMTLFEAARWAPSSYNNQPWRFVYAKRDTPEWQKLFDLMVAFNQGWAQHAAVLIVVISANNFAHNDKPSRTHSFDAGSAWQNFALQGTMNGLVVHGMEGFDYDRAKTALNIPNGYTVEAMIAVGKPGTLENISPDLHERANNPSDRKKVEEFVFEGAFAD